MSPLYVMAILINRIRFHVDVRGLLALALWVAFLMWALVGAVRVMADLLRLFLWVVS